MLKTISFILTLVHGVLIAPGDFEKSALPSVPSFCLTAPDSETALDVSGNRKVPGTPLILWPFHGYESQRFSIESGSEDTVRIVALTSGLCLESTTAGAIQTGSRSSAPSQQWTLLQLSHDQCQILDPSGTMAITRTGNNLVRLQPADSSPQQLWRIRRIINDAYQPTRDRSAYADIPIIDVHNHIGGNDGIQRFVAVGERLRTEHATDIALWIDLNAWLNPSSAQKRIIEVVELSGGRVISTISTYRKDRLPYTPEDIATAMSAGAAGYKIWWGFSRGVDDPANDAIYSKMEELSFPIASGHIVQPFFRDGNTKADYIDVVNRWEHMLQKHPKLITVTAHMGFLLIDDEQYARMCRMLDAYPNLYFDTSYGFNTGIFKDHDRLRKFFIRYQDRILFGSDLMSDHITDENIGWQAAKYDRVFRIFETDEYVSGSLFVCGGDTNVFHGLSLPREVLEKLYYRNAVRLYPGLQDRMRKLGYQID